MIFLKFLLVLINPSQDSSDGSILAWYRGGPGLSEALHYFITLALIKKDHQVVLGRKTIEILIH